MSAESISKTRSRSVDIVNAGLRKRYRAEKRFQLYGILAIAFAIVFLALLFTNIIGKGYSAFVNTQVKLEIFYDPAIIDPSGTGNADDISRANYAGIIRKSMDARFPEVTERSEKRALYALISSGASFTLRKRIIENPELIGQHESLWLASDDEIDMLNKGYIDREAEQGNRTVSDKEVAWLDKLDELGLVRKGFNSTFFTAGDSREPEQAGIRAAITGTFFMLIITMALSFPIGVAAAVYLEEFAPQNKWTDLIEVNINNLAAVPSIVFGLLGLAVFINFFGLPRSAPLIGGLVLTLMTLPIIIIASRAALKSVPPSIREAALGIGASKVQTITHHVLPLALPGMLTGTIIGMAHALGESAPLLMIGMIAFIVDVPSSALDPSTALPVQIYLWADSPERAFVEKTSAAIMVLLAFLLFMNALAIFLRKRFERRW